MKLILRSHFCKLQLSNLVTCLKETLVNTQCNSLYFTKYFAFGVNDGCVIVSYAVVRNPRCCIIKKPNICSLAHSDRSAVDWGNARIDFRTKNTHLVVVSSSFPHSSPVTWFLLLHCFETSVDKGGVCWMAEILQLAWYLTSNNTPKVQAMGEDPLEVFTWFNPIS